MKRSREELIKSDLKSGICHNDGSCADSSFGTRSVVDATSADKENDPGAAQVKRNEEESNECSNDNGEDPCVIRKSVITLIQRLRKNPKWINPNPTSFLRSVMPR